MKAKDDENETRNPITNPNPNPLIHVEKGSDSVL